jgi:hypothetical protein
MTEQEAYAEMRAQQGLAALRRAVEKALARQTAIESGVLADFEVPLGYTRPPQRPLQVREDRSKLDG